MIPAAVVCDVSRMKFFPIAEGQDRPKYGFFARFFGKSIQELLDLGRRFFQICGVFLGICGVAFQICGVFLGICGVAFQICGAQKRMCWNVVSFGPCSLFFNESLIAKFPQPPAGRERIYVVQASVCQIVDGSHFTNKDKRSVVVFAQVVLLKPGQPRPIVLRQKVVKKKDGVKLFPKPIRLEIGRRKVRLPASVLA